MTNTEMLRNRIKQKGLKYNHIAMELGITPYGFRKKAENDTEFKASEIKKVASILDLSPVERDEIFFAG